MKIYLGTAGIPHTSKERSTVSGIRRIKELGLSALEVEFVRGVKMSVSAAKEAGRIAKELEIKLSVHAPYFINLCSSEKEKVDASKKRILESVERAFYLNANPVVFHPGYYGNLSKDKAYEMIKVACSDIIEKIEKSGWEEIKIGLETTGKISQFGSIEEVIKISKEVKGCCPVVDFSHIYARNGGKIDFKEILEMISTLKLKHLHCHFSGMMFTPAKLGGNEKKHLNLTEGAKPDFKPLIEELKKVNFDITLISESPNLEEDAMFMKALIERY